MVNLRLRLKEYFELSDDSVEEFISQFEADWYALIAQKMPDDQAADVMEKLLGIVNWTKTKPA